MFFPNKSSNRDDHRHSGNGRDRDSQRHNWQRDDRSYDDRKRSRTGDSDDRSYHSDRRRRRDDYDEDYRDDYREEKRRSRSPIRKRDPPSNKLILTSLPPDCDRDQMNIILSQHGFCPIDVRVIKKNTEAGNTRTFGFIDFKTVDEAVAYVEYTRGILQFDDGFESRIEYARENDPSYAADKKAYGSSDWFCAKCSINNFNRRTTCFKCGTTREESDMLEGKGYTYIGSVPCDTLLVRELPITANELSIISAFASYSNVPIQRIKISQSTKYCFVQLRSVEDAHYLLNTFNRVVPNINGCQVIITFSSVSLNKIILTENVNALKSQAGISRDQVREDPVGSALALAANSLQMIHTGRFDPHSRQTISTPVGLFPLYTKPDPRTFQHDPTSGYFYDPNGFYYDPKSGYYFNNTTQAWCFWNTQYSTYIPVEGPEPERAIRAKLQQQERALLAQETEGSETAENAEASTQKTESAAEGSKKDEPKTALEIQREMQKWAKKQEKKKKAEQQEAAFSKNWNDEASKTAEDRLTSEQRRTSESSGFGLYDNVASKQSSAEFDIKKYLDWTNLTCLLCQRKFKSAEVLEKHCQKSDLHKSNVTAKMAEFGQSSAASSSSTKPDRGSEYRDRAKERRQKFGLDPGLLDPKEATTEPITAMNEQKPLDETNIGNRLLKSLGWSGQGLGKNQQGIVTPIIAEQRAQGVGLGATGSKATYASRKERMQQATIARFNNLQD